MPKVWGGQSRNRGSIPGKGKKYSLLPIVPVGSGVYPASSSASTEGKATGRDTDHSRASRAGVQNLLSCTSALHKLCSQGKVPHRWDDSTLLSERMYCCAFIIIIPLKTVQKGTVRVLFCSVFPCIWKSIALFQGYQVPFTSKNNSCSDEDGYGAIMKLCWEGKPEELGEKLIQMPLSRTTNLTWTGPGSNTWYGFEMLKTEKGWGVEKEEEEEGWREMYYVYY